MVTTFEIGRSCNAPIRNVGVSCIEVIPKEKISSTGVCVTLGGYGIRFLGAGAIGLLSASNVLIMKSTILLGCVRKGSVAARFGPQSGRGAVFAPAMGLAIGSEVRGQ